MNKPIDTVRFYKQQEIKTATPAELVGHLFDFGIEACYKKDAQRLRNVIGELVKALNFDYPLAEDFYQLYDFCRQKAAEGAFDDARTILEDLREGWSAVVAEQRPKAPRKPISLNM